MTKNKIKIESKDGEGNECVLYVVRPTKEQNAQAQIVASKVFKDAILSGALVRETLEKLLKDQGIWDDSKQKELEKIEDEIREKLIKLKSGGIKVGEGRQLAIDIRILRMRRTTLLSARNTHDGYTAEAQSDDAKFDYLASVCIVNEEGVPFFEDVDDYRDRANFPAAIEAASKLAGMLYGLEENWEADLPENKFLKKFKFVNNDLRLVDKDGNFVTIDGKPIDENFRYVNEKGQYTDADGTLIDEDGLPVVDVQPFLDDDGNPILDLDSEPTKVDSEPTSE